MEAQVASLCARVGLPAILVDRLVSFTFNANYQLPFLIIKNLYLVHRALELQRMMAAKGGQGLGSLAQTVVCLHLAANQSGTAVDSKAMAKVPGLISKSKH